MEKKTKKLQLKKESITVLSGEKLSRVVGGLEDNGCVWDGVFYAVGEVVLIGVDRFVCTKNGIWEKMIENQADALCK